jgi:hypothetical protein
VIHPGFFTWVCRFEQGAELAFVGGPVVLRRIGRRENRECTGGGQHLPRRIAALHPREEPVLLLAEHRLVPKAWRPTPRRPSGSSGSRPAMAVVDLVIVQADDHRGLPREGLNSGSVTRAAFGRSPAARDAIGAGAAYSSRRAATSRRCHSGPARLLALSAGGAELSHRLQEPRRVWVAHLALHDDVGRRDVLAIVRVVEAAADRHDGTIH